MADLTRPYDVLVIGGGNAALCAAVTAREAGARVLLFRVRVGYFARSILTIRADRSGTAFKKHEPGSPVTSHKPRGLKWHFAS